MKSTVNFNRTGQKEDPFWRVLMNECRRYDARHVYNASDPNHIVRHPGGRVELLDAMGNGGLCGNSDPDRRPVRIEISRPGRYSLLLNFQDWLTTRGLNGGGNIANIESPYTIIHLSRMLRISGDFTTSFIHTRTTATSGRVIGRTATNNVSVAFGNGRNLGFLDTDWHIFHCVVDAPSNSRYFIDRVPIITGNFGSDGIENLNIGARSDGSMAGAGEVELCIIFPFAVDPEELPRLYDLLDLRPSGYDPYLSQGAGCPLWFGGPGNYRFTQQAFVVMPIEYTGSALTSVQYNNRTDEQGSNVGYSTGDGGRVSVEAYSVVSTEPLILGELLGTTAEVTDPVLVESWLGEWVKAGGIGNPHRFFRDFPTFHFEEPIDLASNGLNVGDLVAFRFVQHDPESGTVSMNHINADLLDQVDSLRSAYTPWRNCRTYVDSASERKRQFPLLLMGFADGMVKGNPWIPLAGSAFPSAYTLDGVTKVRQIFQVERGEKLLTRIWLCPFRAHDTYVDNLTVRLLAPVGTVGGPADGTLIQQWLVSPEDVAYSGSVNNPDAVKVVSISLDPGILLADGRIYYLELGSEGAETPYRIRIFHRFTIQPNVGLRTPDHTMNQINRGQENFTTGEWRDIQGGTGIGKRNDVPVFLEFS